MSLISVSELSDRIGEPDLVVVDCRWYLGLPDNGQAAYVAGHIPTSAFADLETVLSGPTGGGRHPLPTPEAFGTAMARLGVTPRSTVVAYDDCGGAVAARLWWMLSDQGHSASYVLDGGIDAWIEAGGSLTAGVEPRGAGTVAIETRPWNHVAQLADVEDRSSQTVLVDVRASERYRGDVEPVDPKAGHIPGAINIPLSESLNGFRFHDAATIASQLAEAAIFPSSDVIAHCGSGVNACHFILAAEIAGLPRPRLFVGSWSEWSGTDRPISVGENP